MSALACPRLRVSALRLAVLPLWAMTSLLSAQKPAPAPGKPAAEARHAVFPEKELLITHRDVTESKEAEYPGPLSFGYLMEQLAGKPRAPEFTLSWMRLWLRDQEVNRDTAPARPRMEEILEAWRKKDQAGGPDDEIGWSPNLKNAPFKLIAVVNRMDLLAISVVERLRAARERTARDLAFLRGELLAMAPPVTNKDFTELSELFHRTSPELNTPAASLPIITDVSPGSEFVGVPGAPTRGFGYYATDSQNGEGRFVFALTDASGIPLDPGFNVIFEYSLPGPAASAGALPPKGDPAITWANKWHHLGTHSSFDDAYLAELVVLTKEFTDQRPPRNSNERWSPPALGQIRTNDGVLDPVREFREFRMVPGTQPLDPDAPAVMPRLRQVPVGQTPAEQYKEGAPQRILATVLKSRLENFRKEAPVLLPAAVLMARETEPNGLLGARALLPGHAGEFTWKVNGLQEKGLTRHFSMLTCNGCHGGDTKCDNGLHLQASPAGTLASAFLTTSADSSPQSEMRDRATILKALLESGERDSDNTLMKLLHRRHRATH